MEKSKNAWMDEWTFLTSLMEKKTNELVELSAIDDDEKRDITLNWIERCIKSIGYKVIEPIT